MTLLWIVLAVVYIACWVYFGLATFRKGHYWMFWIGFFIPILWIIGAFIAPTNRAAAGRRHEWRISARRRRHRGEEVQQSMTTTTSRARRPVPGTSKGGAVAVPHLSVAERVARGKAARAEVPRSRHAVFEPSPDRVDP